MKLVDEQNDVLCFFKFVHHRFHSLFKLAAVLRPGNKSGKVERDNAFVVENARNFFLDNAICQAFGDRGFTDTRFSDQYGIVFLAAAQHLSHPFDFFFASYNRVEFTFDSQFRKVAAKIIEHRCLRFILLLFRGLMSLRRRRWLAADNIIEFVAHDVVVDVKLMHDLRCDIIVIAQER